MAIQGHVFWRQWNGDKGLNNTMYNNVDLISYIGAESIGKPESPRFNYPTVVWRPAGNPREYPHKPYIARTYRVIGLHLRRWYVWFYFYSNFRDGIRKTHMFWNSASWPFKVIQGRWFSHQSKARTVYTTFYWSSTVTLVLSCSVSEILQVFCWEQRPTPIPPEFQGCFPWTRLPMLRLSINLELVQPICSRYINVTDRRIYGQTDGRLTIAIPH